MTINRINYESGKEKGRIELKGRFLIELRDNAFSETNGKDVIEHIENFLKIVDSLNIPNISNNQLRPWTDECNLLLFKNRTAKWPTCNWKEDGYCNTGDLPGFIREGNSIRYEDYEWYDTNEDSELKEEALINKRILEESMNAIEESSDDKWDHDSPVDEWKDYEHTTYIRTDASSNQNTYNNACQIVMNQCKTQEEQGWFDEHKLTRNDDDDIS
nr:hypothetical protein [Tanacetum cinerariifolium]